MADVFNLRACSSSHIRALRFIYLTPLSNSLQSSVSVKILPDHSQKHFVALLLQREGPQQKSAFQKHRPLLSIFSALPVICFVYFPASIIQFHRTYLPGSDDTATAELYSADVSDNFHLISVRHHKPLLMEPLQTNHTLLVPVYYSVPCTPLQYDLPRLFYRTSHTHHLAPYPTYLVTVCTP